MAELAVGTEDTSFPQDHFIQVHGLRLHYLDWGNPDAPPMLLLHGFMTESHSWDEFARAFRSAYHIIALDQRGHGESDRSPDLAYSLSDHFADLSAIFEKLRLCNPILVGHSMGGRNALFFAACTSQPIDRLVLVDARPGQNMAASEEMRRFLLAAPRQAGSLDEVVVSILSCYPKLSKEAGYHLAGHGYRQTADGMWVPKFDLAMNTLVDRLEYEPEDLWGFMENVTCPTLITRGEGSTFVSRADAREMSRFIPDAEWVEIPGATHLPVQENPAFFQAAVAGFLKRTAPGGTLVVERGEER